MGSEVQQSGYDENVIHKMIKMDLKLDQHIEEIECSDHGHDQGPECLLNDNLDEKWCCDFDPDNEPKIKFKFNRPVFIRGYSLTYGNDAEHRDPMEWKIKVDDEQTEINHLQDDYDHEEKHFVHESYFEGPPERHSTHKFCLSRPVWTKKIEFKFKEVRDTSEESLFQIGGIEFFC